ncbi:MAG: hypothetical protein P8J50_01660 [Acidimicrobiales bacterium]|jgi:hypothetical protein|nr:hypothetical protein [Acidimicrobiales bacterium]
MRGAASLAVAVIAAARSSGGTSFPVELDALTESWDCYYALAGGAPDQTTRIRIELAGSARVAYSLDAASLPQIDELPSDRWKATLDVGTDLFDNWCVDIGAPRSVIMTTYEAVAGRLELSRWPVVDREPLTVWIRDLEVAGPDGRVHTIGDIELTSDAFGQPPPGL